MSRPMRSWWPRSIWPCRTRTPTWCARASRRSACRRSGTPDRIVIILDHRVPAESEKTATTHKAIREFVRQQNIRNFYDVGRGGICHQVLAENGHVLPGMVVVGHRFAHHHARRFRRLRHRHRRHRNGRRVDRRAALVQGALHHPHRGERRARRWISAKDLILYIIGSSGADGADYRAVEFDGPVIRNMSVAGRMVLANLSMEMGAKVAFTPVDDKLLRYLARRTSRPAR